MLKKVLISLPLVFFMGSLPAMFEIRIKRTKNPLTRYLLAINGARRINEGPKDGYQSKTMNTHFSDKGTVEVSAIIKVSEKDMSNFNAEFERLAQKCRKQGKKEQAKNGMSPHLLPLLNSTNNTLADHFAKAMAVTHANEITCTIQAIFTTYEEYKDYSNYDKYIRRINRSF